MNFMVPSRKPTTPSYSSASCTNGSASRSLDVGALGRLMEMRSSSRFGQERAFTQASLSDYATIGERTPIHWDGTAHCGPWGHTGNQTNVKLLLVQLYTPDRLAAA